jgi:hypothetical protein
MEPKRGMSSGDVWWTLEDFVMAMIECKQTDTPEFKALISVFSREKLAGIYTKYIKLKKGELQ